LTRSDPSVTINTARGPKTNRSHAHGKPAVPSPWQATRGSTSTPATNRLSALDPVWIGAISAIGGVSATGVFNWFKSIADNRSREREAEAQRAHERNESEAQREHDEAERSAQRDHEPRTALLAQRKQQIG
jgi:hypothetical protein